MSPKLRRNISVGLTLLAIIIAWELATYIFAISKVILPAPTEVAKEFTIKYFLLPPHIMTTVYEVLIAFAVAAVIGILLGILIVYSDFVREVLFPIIISLQIVPKIALAPLVLIWFGYGLLSKIVIAFLVAFFPILVNTMTGLVAVEPELIDLARGLRATKFQIFRKIRFPNALPNIFAGFKISITLSVVGAVVGEFIGGDQGLGYLVMLSNYEINTPLMFTSLAILAAVGLSLFGCVVLLEKVVIPWHISQEEELVISSQEGA